MQISISQISKLTDVSPSTLRSWEKQGLIKPKRSKGNQRIYTRQDFYRINYILYLNRERKVAFSEIREKLEKSFPEEIHNKQFDKNEFLMNISWKEKRKERKLSLQEVADKINISISYLSKIENGATNVSLNIMENLAHFYNVNILNFHDVNFTKKTVTKSSERVSFYLNELNITVEKLGESIDKNISMTLYKIPKGSERVRSHTHQGFEMVFVKKGSCIFYLGDEVFYLKEGDTIQFDSSRKHSWKNNYFGTTELLWVYVN